MTCGAVIPAAGQARRFGDRDKTLQPIAGRPVLEWCIRALVDSGTLSQIVIVVSGANQFPVLDLVTRLQSPIPISTVRGGDLRMISVRAGVNTLSGSCEFVLVHDAARPLVSPDLVRASVEAARIHGAAIPGLPVTDTIKQVEGGRVVQTVDRSMLVAVQTPQVFRREWLLTAYEQIDPDTEATDEASIIENAGFPVQVIPGEPSNLKVTTSGDATIAAAFLSERVESR